MRKIIIYTLLLLTLSFAGCGKDNEQILAFQNELNTVVMKMEALDNKLNTIDVTAPDAAESALKNLSDLKKAFDELSAINVTDKNYTYISGLADEGAEYMTKALEFYEKAYGQDKFDKGSADLAYQYLERATKRVRVMVTMLHGEVPDDVILH